MDSIENMRECPDCAGTNIIYIDSRDQLVCRDCGLVFEPLTPIDEKKFETSHNIDLGLEMPKGKAVSKPAKQPKKKSKPSKKKPVKKVVKKAAKKKKR